MKNVLQIKTIEDKHSYFIFTTFPTHKIHVEQRGPDREKGENMNNLQY